MGNLFEHCEGWENCENEDLKNLFENKMVEGEKFKLPEGDELERLNKICIKCNHALTIEERKCPVCENENLQASPWIAVDKEKKSSLPLTSIESNAGSQYFYKCENRDCERILYSHKKL